MPTTVLRPLPASNPHDIGKIISLHRRQKKLTQTELARTAGVSKSWVIKLENAKTPNLELGRFMKVCSALDLVVALTPTDPVSSAIETALRSSEDTSV